MTISAKLHHESRIRGLQRSSTEPPSQTHAHPKVTTVTQMSEKAKPKKQAQATRHTNRRLNKISGQTQHILTNSTTSRALNVRDPPTTADKTAHPRLHTPATHARTTDPPTPPFRPAHAGQTHPRTVSKQPSIQTRWGRTDAEHMRRWWCPPH